MLQELADTSGITLYKVNTADSVFLSERLCELLEPRRANSSGETAASAPHPRPTNKGM